jgi:transcriptional regulator of acetoin/glycerol metabolism
MARQAMREAVAAAGGNVSLAAKRLGVNRSTLYRRLLSPSGERH